MTPGIAPRISFGKLDVMGTAGTAGPDRSEHCREEGRADAGRATACRASTRTGSVLNSPMNENMKGEFGSS